MRPPLISIITPTKNNEETIEKTILSVANQRYKNIEHIIVDSTSSDNTVSLILAHQKKFDHIRLISERDKGAYPAMNKGIDMSVGEWIYFLGGDDQLFDENTLAQLFQKGSFSKYQVVYGNVLIHGEAAWAKDQDIYDGPFDLQKLLTKNICHQAIFYPRRLIRKVGYFNPDYTITADWDYNLRCYAETAFFHVDQTIAVFTAGGLSTKKREDLLGNDFSQNVIQYFKLNPFDPSLQAPDSPFYDIIKRFQHSDAAKQDKDLVINTDDQPTESLSILEQQGLILDKQEIIKNQQELILQKEKRILDQRDQMVNQYESIKKQLGQIVKLDEVIQNQHRLIQQKEELIHQQQEQALRQEKVIKDQQELILKKDNSISLHQDQILKKDQTIKEKQELLLEREKLAVKQEDQVLQQQVSLTKSHDLILQKEELIIKHENLIQKNEEIIQKQVDEIRENSERISRLTTHTEKNEKLISTCMSRIQELEKTLDDQNNMMQAKESVIREKHKIIEEKELIIDWKERELSTVYHSYTWRIGKVLLSPFTFIHMRFRKTSE